ncbi:hypothetical protein QVD17_21245 [Tagetes erecta]|uniref:Uncharacterized protein n=1 Tax=Tagetes erecta TaxID=13708 RepID=A0AAD8NXW9_TARER|nr:hypothetical protein QVD17_21245 [Tagetes erecta]
MCGVWCVLTGQLSSSDDGERSGDEEEGRGTTSSPPRRKRGGPRALLLSSPSRFLLVIAQTSPLPRPRAHTIILLVTPLLRPLPAPLNG